MDYSTKSLQTQSISAAAWNKLLKMNIYFGHMSVGYDIIEGIKIIKKNNPDVTLNILETTNPDLIKNGVLAHSTNGQNTRPKTKVDAFVKTMDSGMAKKADVAFFKFCYVDFDETTDVNDLFAYYSSSMDRLIKKYPGVNFMHMTAPLTTEGEFVNIKYFAKYLIKKILGREKNSLINIKRNEFNALLRKKYDSKKIIDIELFESARPDGTRYETEAGGRKHYSLVPAYTYDGGHLNDTGKTLVADKFLVRLCAL